MIGPEDFHDALFELSTLLLGEEDSHSILQRIVDLTAAAVPGCAHCGVSLLTGERVTTAAATDGTTLQLDGAQYSNSEGPPFPARAVHRQPGPRSLCATLTPQPTARLPVVPLTS